MQGHTSMSPFLRRGVLVNFFKRRSTAMTEITTSQSGSPELPWTSGQLAPKAGQRRGGKENCSRKPARRTARATLRRGEQGDAHVQGYENLVVKRTTSSRAARAFPGAQSGDRSKPPQPRPTTSGELVLAARLRAQHQPLDAGQGASGQCSRPGLRSTTASMHQNAPTARTAAEIRFRTRPNRRTSRAPACRATRPSRQSCISLARKLS